MVCGDSVKPDADRRHKTSKPVTASTAAVRYKSKSSQIERTGALEKAQLQELFEPTALSLTPRAPPTVQIRATHAEACCYFARRGRES